MARSDYGIGGVIMRNFFRLLMWIFILLLISGVVLSVTFLLERPLIEGVYVLVGIFSIWFSIVLVRKAIIRYRAKSQVKSLLNTENPEDQNDNLGMTPSELKKSLSGRWNQTIRALKRSQLKFQGDPLYVLPWYMIFGRPASGKSTSLRNAKLLLPSIDLSIKEDGSTLNLEWWLHEEGIIIDTAGRYAVPDNLERDRKEWNQILSMLSRHKQKEPLNGLVLVVAADRLLNCSEDELLEEGRQVRNSINRMMEKLEVKVPVYLMVTKADLIPGFAEWVKYIPDVLKNQAMGYLNESESGDYDSIADIALDSVLDRLKEIRLLMMEQTDSPNDALLTLPQTMEGLRPGLHTFIRTALQGNAYQEAPRFRGLYFSSSLHAENGDTVRDGLFLHDFFAKILPPDRGLLVSLPSAVRFRRAIKKYALGISGALTFVSAVALTALYNTDSAFLSKIETNFSGTIINVSDESQTPSMRLDTAYRLKSMIESVQAYKDQEYIPWMAMLSGGNQVENLKKKYIEYVQNLILFEYDNSIKLTIDELKEQDTSVLAGGLVRRINILQKRLNPDFDFEIQPIGNDYIIVQDDSVGDEESILFSDIYISYVSWSQSLIGLDEEKKRLQAALLHLIKQNHGDYSWIIQWANSQGFDSIQLKDFWGGSIKLADAPEISSAYTLEGYEFIQEFLTEFQMANTDDKQLSDIQQDFNQYYQRKYINAWTDFGERFDEGKQKQRDRKEWTVLLDRMATSANPYFTLLQTMQEQLEPFSGEDYQSKDKIAFFSEIQSYSISDGRKGKGGGKLIKKALGKLGKVGKLAKKGMKIHKKATKGSGADEDNSGALEEAVKAVDAYKQALAEVAFKADSRSQSLATITTLFLTPDSPETGNGPLSSSWVSVKELQALIGKPISTSRLFWKLYMGPIYAAYDYMQKESSCAIQDRWEDNVLASIDGVSKNDLGNLLVGEGGVLWNFLDSEIAPFVKKQYKKGYVRANVEQRSLELTETFLDVLNQSAAGAFVVGNQFTVSMNALPSGANSDAKVSPYATFIDLHCSDGTQTMANYNYPTQHDFSWSLETCGDTTLRIEIGQLTLLKEYLGVKGFGRFLLDFQDGRRIFTVDDFPNQKAQLVNNGVRFIDVSYEINGQRPVIQMLDTVPLELPQQAAYCW
jgi:type VI secretion system protein ImpL